MEEDIGILEEVLKDKEWYKKHGGEDIGFREVQAIENLIKGYRELEEKVLILEGNKIGYKLAIEDSIQKSKIKEKIEELKQLIDCLTDEMQKAIQEKDESKFDLYNKKINDISRQIEILQEILEVK